MVDMVVVVVDTRRLHPDRLQQCLLRLDGAGANVIGVVLNRTRRRRRAGSYQYGYYGKEDSQLVPPAPLRRRSRASLRRPPWPGPGGWAPRPPPTGRPSPSVVIPVGGAERRATGLPVPSAGTGPDDPGGRGTDGAAENEPRRRQPEW